MTIVEQSSQIARPGQQPTSKFSLGNANAIDHLIVETCGTWLPPGCLFDPAANRPDETRLTTRQIDTSVWAQKASTNVMSKGATLATFSSPDPLG